MTAKALILGGRTGLLGQALVRTLNAHDWTAAALGREDGDLHDVDFLKEQLERTAPDVIFNTVGWTQVDAAEDEKDAALRWNRALPDSLARLVKGTSCHLVHYSTDFVFSGAGDRPYTEADTPKPLSVYGASKLAGEQAVLQLAPENSCIVRTAWLFGPGRKNFVSTILEACRRRDTISVVHDQVGSPTYTLDLAHWSLLLAEKRATGIVHAANSGQASWCDLACESVSLAGAPCRVDPIPSSEWPQRAPRPAFSPLDTTHLTALIGLTPRPWPQALRDYLFKEYLPAHTTKS